MTIRPIIVLILTAFFLTACGGGYKEPPPLPPQLGDDNVKVGTPYTVDGVTYYPRVDNNYDVVGNASWYGPDFHGKRTANGELYDMNSLTAAHTTLPMPSYVRVTNLTNGRSLVLRVNDRGPFVKSRVIDVSRRAAQLLGFAEQGIQRVRVQAVQPDGTPYPKIIDGGLTPVPQRTAEMDIEEQPLDMPEGTNTVTAGTAGATGSDGIENTPSSPAIEQGYHIFVQVASFSNKENALILAGQLRDVGPVVIQGAEVNSKWFYRVRVGAYGVMEEALAALARIKNLGFSDAHIFTEPTG